jgi:hypothetical protein
MRPRSVALVTFALALAACSSSAGAPGAPDPTPRAPMSPAPSVLASPSLVAGAAAHATPTAAAGVTAAFALVPRVVEPAAVIASPIQLSGAAAAAAGAIWLGTTAGLERIDPVAGTVRVVSPVRGAEVVARGDVLWRAAFYLDAVTRWDATTARQVLSVPVPTATGLTDSGPLWASEHHGGVIVRLDERTGRIVQTVKIGTAGVPGAGAILAVGGDLWVVHVSDQDVVEVDPVTGKVLARVALQEDPCEYAGSAAGSVWVSLCDSSTVRRLDPATRALGPAVTFPGLPGPASELGGQPWVPVGDELVRMDPATGLAAAAVRVDVSGLSIDEVLEAFGSVWAIADDGRIVKLDVSAVS